MESNMRKKIILGLLSLIVSTTSVLDAKADDFFDKLKNIINPKKQEHVEEAPVEKFYNGVIEPFGGLSWDDGLKDVVEKLLKIEGLETLNLEFTERHDIISLKSIKIADLPKKVAEGIVKRNDVYSNPKDGRFIYSYFMENAPSHILGKYKDKNYKDVVYYPHDMFIEASPIMINQVPFTLRIDFANLPPLGIDRPNKVFKDKLGYAYALVPVLVVLESSSPTLINEHHKEISENLKKKYGIEVPTVARGAFAPLSMKYSSQAFKGDKDSFLSAAKFETSYTIKYESTHYKQPYIELYRKHLDDFEINKNKGKKDLKNGL